MSQISRPSAPCARLAGAVKRFRADERGATAVEFGLLALPFFLIAMAVMTIGSQHLSAHLLDRGVAEASRKLRTGEAQKAGMTLKDFRKLVCDSAGSIIDCGESLLAVHVQSKDRFADLTISSCLDKDGELAAPPGAPDDNIRTRSGDASKAVLVLVCYDWKAGIGLWNTIWNLIAAEKSEEAEETERPDKIILSAVAAFRSEPYE